MWYRVRIEAQHKTSGQRQECDRRLIADHPQAATAAGLQLLGINGRDWAIQRCEAIAAAEQRAA